LEALARRALRHTSSVFRLAVLRSLAGPLPPPCPASAPLTSDDPAATNPAGAGDRGSGGSVDDDGDGGGGWGWGLSADLVLGAVLGAVDDPGLLRPSGGPAGGADSDGPTVGWRTRAGVGRAWAAHAGGAGRYTARPGAVCSAEHVGIDNIPAYWTGRGMLGGSWAVMGGKEAR
jgi:hypothetical protein